MKLNKKVPTGRMLFFKILQCVVCLRMMTFSLTNNRKEDGDYSSGGEDDKLLKYQERFIRNTALN